MKNLPRGIRNNNPLNIRRSGQPWRGKIIPGTDPEFEQFDCLESGIRAAFIILRTYIKKYRCDTPARIIARWAPASENDTKKYIEHVETISLLPRHQRLALSEKNAICRLLWAMARFECGREIGFGHFENAYALAFRNP